MFPFHRGDELFEIPYTTQPDHDHNNNGNIIQHLNHDHQDHLIPMATTTHNSVPLQIPAFGSVDHSAKNESIKRKILHRETEKQRRLEMSNLYSSLRSQLSLKYIKGKRSISDHMNEAVNYIRHKQNRIKELSLIRDTLKLQSDAMKNSSSSSSGFTRYVEVRESWCGVEIVLMKGLKNNYSNSPSMISEALHTLHEDGFVVLGYVSSTINERLIYTIQVQVEDGKKASLDFRLLEKKLHNTISSCRS